MKENYTKIKREFFNIINFLTVKFKNQIVGKKTILFFILIITQILILLIYILIYKIILNQIEHLNSVCIFTNSTVENTSNFFGIKEEKSLYYLVGGLIILMVGVLLYENWTSIVDLFPTPTIVKEKPDLTRLYSHIETRLDRPTRLTVDIWHSLDKEEQVRFIRQLCKKDLLSEISKYVESVDEFKNYGINDLHKLLIELKSKAEK
jgi:hypothetical protein